MKVRALVWALLLLAGIFLSTLGANESRAENQLRVRLVADPLTFDWNLAHTSMETAVVMNIMEGLVAFDSAMKPKPALAKSWQISKDQRVYTFKIRPGVKWSDGKPLKAADFVYSWKRLLDPLTAASYAYMLFDIEGAEDFNSKKLSDFAKVGIKTIDDQTVQIRLKKPVTYLLQLFSFWVTFPTREDIVFRFGSTWSQPGKMVVLGPFIPVSYAPQSQILLKRNENYYGPKPAADSILFRIVNEDTTALHLFKSGQLDFVRPVNFLEMGELRKTPLFHSDPYFRTCFININHAKYPFNLPKVRQALAMAIEKSNIPQVMHQPYEPATSYVHPKLFPEGKEVGYSYDPEKARALLKEAGVDPKTLPKIELAVYASDENTLLAQYLQDQLRKNLGLQVVLHMPEFKTFRNQLELGTYPLYYRCWGADYADPDSYLGIFLSSSGNSRTAWKNAYYDAVIRKAGSLPAGHERTRMYKEALDILLRKDAVIVPLYYDVLTYLLNPKIKNFVINPLNYVFFKDVVWTK